MLWDGDTNAVAALLNLFAATCHIHYAKSAQLYIQEMRKRPSTHPWLHQKFVEEYHTVRRTERQWARLWTDIVIEQVQITSLKSRGGLTRGRGMTESVRQQWLYSTQACAAIHDAMTSLAGKHNIITYSACGVRRGNAIALLARPEQMYRLVWFTWSIWWQCTAASFSIQRVGSKSDETEKVVSEIQESFDSVSVRNATIKETSDGAHHEWVEAGVKVDKSTVQIDHSILFLRCRALAQRDNEDSFAHRMTAVPTSLFKDFFLRKVDKSELGREIKKNMMNIMADCATPYSMLVIDGGSLLHLTRG